MTGYRSGAIVSKNEKIIKLLKKMRSPMGVGTPSFIQSAAIAAWQDTGHVALHRELYLNKRNRLKQALETAGLTVFGGEAGFYMWIRSDQFDQSDALAKWFLDRGILVVPGTVFGPDGNPYIRMVYCLKDETIDKLCERILQ